MTACTLSGGAGDGKKKRWGGGNRRLDLDAVSADSRALPNHGPVQTVGRSATNGIGRRHCNAAEMGDETVPEQNQRF